MVYIRKITKGIIATTLSLGIVSGTVSPAFAEDTISISLPKTAEEIIMEKIQKETSKMNAKQKQAYYDKVINAIVKEAKKEKNVVAKIKLIHDKLASRITYDNPTLEGGKGSTKESYTKLGVIVNGKGVSQGYSEVFRDVLTKVGITNKLLTDKTFNHQWNLVKIDGKFYHIDLTWDDSFDMEIPSYGYFLVNDTKIKEEHPTYVPTTKSKSTSTKYLAFSKIPEWVSFISDNTGITYVDDVGIHKVDITGKLTTYQKLSEPTDLVEVRDKKIYLYSRVEIVSKDGKKTNTKYTLYEVSKSNLKKKKVLYTSKEYFYFEFQAKHVSVELTGVEIKPVDGKYEMINIKL